MTNLIAAAIAFAGLHLFISGTRLRDPLVAGLGTRAYLGLFAALSAATLAWLIWAYGEVRVPTPTQLPGLRIWAAALVAVAFLFMVLGVATRGPTAVGGDRATPAPLEARGIHRITRHPFLWGISLWALVHAALNPAAPHLVFFGTFVLVGVAGTASIDAKRARTLGAAWQGYAAQTSNLPFAAIVAGRNRLAWDELGIGKLVAAAIGFVAFAATHARFFGVAPF